MGESNRISTIGRMIDVLNILRHIITEKRQKHIVPDHALRMEVWKKVAGHDSLEEIDAQLTRLVASGAIVRHPTIRDTAFTIKGF